jgi:hypothetical protein
MIRNQFLSATLSIAGLFLVAPAVIASPVVKINDGQPNSCTVTPSSGTVFTLSTTGDVLINGTYTAGTCSTSGGGGSGSGDPTFSPFSPAPADLAVLPRSLPSTGGTVTPAFVAYYATGCTGKVTAGSGCTLPSGPWGTGGQVCTGQLNAKGQTYCSPSGTVTLPNNASTTSSCTYTFQAINCTNGTTSTSSQLANVLVPATVVGNCTDGDTSGDLGAFGYSRQCAGAVRSFNNSLSPTWNNSYAGLMSGNWPGAAGQFGFGLAVTVNAMQYGSFKFNTGSTVAGVHFEANNSFGQTGTMSVSTSPGDFYGGTSLCNGSSPVNISTKSGTAATCKLNLNTDYYLNISMSSSFSGHTTNCTTSSCTTGWLVYSYSN